jgi:hypothetical protein
MDLAPTKSPKKSPRKSPIPFRKKKTLIRGETTPGPGGSGGGSGGGGLSVDTCKSQPSSPSLSGRLGRATSKILSRSDANLMHSLKVRWVRYMLYSLISN